MSTRIEEEDRVLVDALDQTTKERIVLNFDPTARRVFRAVSVLG